MVAVLLKFLYIICLPALALWFLVYLVAAPLAVYLPVYFKLVLTPIWFVLSFFVALLGWKRRLGFWGYFLISLIFSPLVGVLSVMLSGKKKRAEAA